MVIVLERERGLPMAMTNSPGRTEVELPRGITGRFLQGIRTVACCVGEVINELIIHNKLITLS